MPRGPREWEPGIKTLKTKAKDNHGYEYTVHLEFGKESKKWVLRIDDTPGSWYMSTILEDLKIRDRIAIDYGQGWYVENFRAIMKEAIGKI